MVLKKKKERKENGVWHVSILQVSLDLCTTWSCIVVLGLGRIQKEDAVFWTVGEHVEFMFISQLVLLAHTDHCLSIVPCHILTI